MIGRVELDVNQTWYTDSNGRDMVQRRFNYRPTWDLDVTDPLVHTNPFDLPCDS